MCTKIVPPPEISFVTMKSADVSIQSESEDEFNQKLVVKVSQTNDNAKKEAVE